MYLGIILLVAVVAAQEPRPLDPNLLAIVGSPSGTRKNIPPHLTDLTSSIQLNEKGEPCQCVPYYLCHNNLQGNWIELVNFTGFGQLDVRSSFGTPVTRENCQGSVERCCTKPKKKEGNVTVPTPPPKGCGYRNVGGFDFTVIGDSGAEAGFGEFPWVVAVLDAFNDSYIGVGALIHPQVVLTAAHIARKRYAPGALKIRAGEWDTQTTKERLEHQERIAQEVYTHSEFNAKKLWNDVALLRLAEPFDLAQHINVICMPNPDESFDSYKGCIANGWGKDVFGSAGRYAVIQKRVEVDMVPRPLCNMQLNMNARLRGEFKLHSSLVCAGGEEGKDMCQGDGGAALACPVGDDRYKLTGLVVGGVGCGKKDVPGIYASVPVFRAWVDHKMAQWRFDISGYQI